MKNKRDCMNNMQYPAYGNMIPNMQVPQMMYPNNMMPINGYNGYQQQMTNTNSQIENRISSLEKRVSKLESMITNTNNNYPDSNYYMV